MLSERKYTRAVTCFNDWGDVVILWDEEAEDRMGKWIEERLAEGCTFFIVKPRALGLLSPSKTPLKALADLKKNKGVSISMDMALFEQLKPTDTSVTIGKREPTSSAPVEIEKASKDPAEIAQSESVMVKPRKGG